MSNTKAMWNVLWIEKTVYIYVKAEINQLISSVNPFGAGTTHSFINTLIHLEYTHRGEREQDRESRWERGEFLYHKFSYKWKISETGQIWRIYSEQGYQAVYLFQETWLFLLIYEMIGLVLIYVHC